MTPLRVLYLVTELDPGGAERQLAALAAGLDRRHFDPAVASLAPPGEMAKPLREAGIPVFSAGARRASDIRALPRLKRLLAQVQPDLLHTFLFHANVAGRLCARLAGLSAPVVASIRVEDPRWWHRAGERLTARWADAFVANSEAMGAFLVREVRLPGRKVTVIPNALLPGPGPEPGAFRREIGLAPEAPLVVGVGRLHPQKGFDTLVEAMAGIPAVLALVGDGQERARLETLARKLGVDLRLPGRLPSAASALADADLVAQPSRWEGMPNAVLEAMALGKAVLGARVGGIPELLDDAGVLVPTDDPSALGEGLRGLLADPSRRASLGHEARRRAGRYTVARMVDAHVALYRRLAAGATGRAA